jgi:hypothetical protein
MSQSLRLSSTLQLDRKLGDSLKKPAQLASESYLDKLTDLLENHIHLEFERLISEKTAILTRIKNQK